MAVLVYKIKNFDHTAETEQFYAIRDFLENRFNGEKKNCILIGNINIEGVELDALLITPGGVRILEFKNWGGNIKASENGDWFSDGKIIKGGSSKSPFEQIRLNKSRVSRCFNRESFKELNLNSYVSAAIIFFQPSNIDDSEITGSVKQWLHIFDNEHLKDELLKKLGGTKIPDNIIKELPEKLNIARFRDTEKNGIVSSNSLLDYEPELAKEFYEKLETSIEVPDLDYKNLYNIFRDIFYRVLEQKTAAININFGGPFPKTDYLLKENSADWKLATRVHDTRVRLKKVNELTPGQLKKTYIYDLQSLCEFIKLLYKIEIPESLSSKFTDKPNNIKKIYKQADCVRMIVSEWDNEFFYGILDDLNYEIKVPFEYTYKYDNNMEEKDWHYLKSLLFKDCQVNLVRSESNDSKDREWHPDLIIFEPDYLIDISSIANCFEAYATTPFVNLIRRIQPNPVSYHTILGNFASQLLDESINFPPKSRSYQQSVNDFFKENALGLMTLSASEQTDFHNDARKQRIHINTAMQVSLPKLLHNVDCNLSMVEPSFFSEMLGIQGRMDFLQLEFKILLEQKSGKGKFPYNNFQKPKQKDPHYVQMLLYMLLIKYNYRKQYEANKGISAYLLYSKYEESLLSLGNAPELVFEAIKVRNEMAWHEILYTKPNGYRILDEISVDKLRKKAISDKYWNTYKKPPIEQILLTIQNASQIEKKYFFRFLTFIANEHYISKVGNRTKENAGFATTWQYSVEDKIQMGNIHIEMELVSPNEETSECERVNAIKLKFSETANNEMSNFRLGDIVIVYSYDKDKEPDMRNTMVFRGNIEELKDDEITLRLRAPQSKRAILYNNSDKFWAIEHDFMESSYSSLYRAMYSFLEAPKERRDLLLFQREPNIDKTITRINSKPDNGFEELVLKSKQAQDFFIIIGPPGTGKTSKGLMNILKEELETPNVSVLLIAYTNRAVDEICNNLREEKIDFIRIGKELSTSASNRNYLLNKKIENSKKIQEIQQMISSTRVFVGTTTTLNTNLALFQLKHFNLAIIDEASQILEPHLLALLSAKNNDKPAISKFVMIGDHKQLPAVVQQTKEQSMVQDDLLNSISLTDCRLSLFERLLKGYSKNDAITYMLTKQGRMHPDIALFPNCTFYKNKLEVVPVEHQQETLPNTISSENGIDRILNTRRISFLAVDAPKEPVSDKVNQVEADIISQFVIRIYELNKEHFEPDKTVGVIVPYRNQIATIRHTIDSMVKDEAKDLLHKITIDTVERYQGSQRDYILYGFTIRQYYQLKFLTNNVFEDEDEDGMMVDRKLNVAITRAKKGLIMVGNPALLVNNFIFFKLMEFIKSKHGYFEDTKENFCSGNFDVPNYDAKYDLSDASFALSNEFDKTYTDLIYEPIKEQSGSSFPELVLGHDMPTNMDAIGYGKIDFSNKCSVNDDNYSPDQQVLIYCYYVMRQHYCSIKNVYTSFKKWLFGKIQSTSGRIYLIDIGCGPATCGIAFGEVFLNDAPGLDYSGIDVSVAMKNMGKQLLDSRFKGKLFYQMVDSFQELTSDYWEARSELPSTIIINISYFFSNVTADFTEKLSSSIRNVMKAYPLNKYVFIIQQSDNDISLHSYKVFRSVLRDSVKVYKDKDDESDTFSYQLRGAAKTFPFRYTILTNK